jgi:hypothetical protein
MEDRLVQTPIVCAGSSCMQGLLILRKALYAGSSHFEGSLVCRVFSF